MYSNGEIIALRSINQKKHLRASYFLATTYETPKMRVACRRMSKKKTKYDFKVKFIRLNVQKKKFSLLVVTGSGEMCVNYS